MATSPIPPCAAVKKAGECVRCQLHCDSNIHEFAALVARRSTRKDAHCPVGSGGDEARGPVGPRACTARQWCSRRRQTSPYHPTRDGPRTPAPLNVPFHKPPGVACADSGNKKIYHEVMKAFAHPYSFARPSPVVRCPSLNHPTPSIFCLFMPLVFTRYCSSLDIAFRSRNRLCLSFSHSTAIPS